MFGSAPEKWREPDLIKGRFSGTDGLSGGMEMFWPPRMSMPEHDGSVASQRDVADSRKWGRARRARCGGD